jgi:hypothetical protein
LGGVGFLDLFKRAAPHSDTVLGVLEWSGGYWKGAISVQGDGALPLRLSGTPAAPDAASLAMALELPDRFGGLLPALETALFEHYQPYRDAVAAGEFPEHPEPFPTIARAADVWEHATPEGVLVAPLDGVVPTIEIALRTDWDVEHTLGARIQDWSLVELCGSI